MADQPAESAHLARDGQSRLAAPVRRGLVRSVDNFGVTGDVPSHPELLDHLAARFVRDGWSVKKLVRTTRADAGPISSARGRARRQLAVDPANRLVWRHSPRRLDAEEMRDAMLAAAGRLESTRRPDGSPAKDLQGDRAARTTAPRRKRAGRAGRGDSVHRSVYLPLLRGLTPTSLEVFDFAEQGMVTGSRDATTVAPQALYLLNDPFVRTQSLALAEAVARSQIELTPTGFAMPIAGFRPIADAAEVERASQYLVEYAELVEPDIAAKQRRSTDSQSGLCRHRHEITDSRETETTRRDCRRTRRRRALPEDPATAE